ncbi:MAG TPA: TonB-dependent receptor [Telluria sp.]|nr:TonB-dependent receptor [Telluria sp.]
MPTLPGPSLWLRPRSVALAAAVLTSASAFAQGSPTVADLTAVPFEQLVNMEVYSASRFVQKASEAPSTVTVITAADIRAFGWRTLADVARSVRGLNVHDDRNYSYLGERGFLRPGDYNTRFLLQIDGMRVNDVVYDQAPLGGEFPLELDLIERIEFVPGPGSSVYGSSAFFGVINVITKRPADQRGLRASLTAGGAGLAKGSAGAAWNDAAGTSYMLAASAYHRGGRDLYFPEFDTPDQNHGVAQGLDWERGHRLYFSAARGGWRASLLHAQRDKGIPTASFEQPFNDGRTFTEDGQSYADLSWSGERGPEQLLVRAFAGRYTSYGDYVYSDGGPTINRDGSQGLWWGAEVKVVSVRFAAHKLVTGIELQRDSRLVQQNYDVLPYQSYLDDRRTGNRAGVYVQDEWALTPNLLLNAGLRHDRYNGVAGVTSPRAALILQPRPDTTLKAIFGSAYRMPNSYEKYYEFLGDGGQLSNPALQRERIASRELAWVQHFGDNQRLTVSVFHNRVDGLINQLPDPATGMPKFFNVGSVAVRGAEAEYLQQFENGVSLRASASQYHVGRETDFVPVEGGTATTSDSGQQQLNAPARLAKLNMTSSIWRSWRAGFEAQYVGPRRALLGTAGGFTVANLNLVANLAPRVELAITAFNLFDRRYGDPGAREHRLATIPQDGRVLQARLTWTF